MRNENIAIFEDTQKRCKTNSVLTDAITKTNQKQEVILQNDPLTKDFQDRGQPAKVTVSKRRRWRRHRNIKAKRSAY